MRRKIKVVYGNWNNAEIKDKISVYANNNNLESTFAAIEQSFWSIPKSLRDLEKGILKIRERRGMVQLN
jgi:hypothetical protein